MKKTSFAHGTIYITIATFVFMISGYLINIFLARYLGPASYGIYGIIITLMGVVNLMQTSGLPQAVSKFVAEVEVKADSILRSGLILQIASTLIASLVLLLLALPFANLLKDNTLVPYLQLSAAVVPLYGIYSLYLNYYNGLHYFKTQAMMNILYAVAKFVAVLIFVYFFKVYGAVLGFIIAPIFALLFWFHFPRKSNYHFPYKKLFFFSIPLIGFAIASNLLQSIDLFFIKALMHADTNTGLYTANQNIAEIPFYGIAALASVLFPSISKHVSNNRHDEAKNLIQKSLRFCLLLLTPAVLLISATSLPILSFLFSSEYHPGAQSLSILVIGSGFFTLFIILATIISSAGSPMKSAILAGIGIIITSLLCATLIPTLGLNGAAMATTIAAGCMIFVAEVTAYTKIYALSPHDAYAAY